MWVVSRIFVAAARVARQAIGMGAVTLYSKFQRISSSLSSSCGHGGKWVEDDMWPAHLWMIQKSEWVCSSISKGAIRTYRPAIPFGSACL